MPDGIDAGDIGFRPSVAQFVDVWGDFRSRDGMISSPGGARFIFEPHPISGRLDHGGDGVSKPCGAGLIRWVVVFVPS